MCPSPYLTCGLLGQPFARVHCISSGSRLFLCTLSGDKVQSPESRKVLFRACVVPAAVLVARLEAKPEAREESLPCHLLAVQSALQRWHRQLSQGTLTSSTRQRKRNYSELYQCLEPGVCWLEPRAPWQAGRDPSTETCRAPAGRVKFFPLTSHSSLKLNTTLI